MKNKISCGLKKIIFAFGLIYGIDLILQKTGVFIPINVLTIAITAFLGVPGVLSVFAILFIIK